MIGSGEGKIYTTMAHYVTYLIGLIFLFGVTVPLIYPANKKMPAFLPAFFPALLFFLLIFLFIRLPDEAVILTGINSGFLPDMPFIFRIDGLSLIFGLMVSGIGALVMAYSAFYMAGYTGQRRFFVYLSLFMGAMLGIVFSDNLLALFIFWEITSITSFFLIGFNHHLRKSRQAAYQALLLTALGGLCLLFATIMVGEMAGTYSLHELYNGNFHLGPHAHYYLVFGLVLVAAATKSAQFPFHFWLPGAMEAPTPVSAYLHSATMVNAGIFLLLRLNPLLGGTVVWKVALIFTGGITMFLGAFFSLGQKDLKRILAFTTISALGTMVLLIGMNTTASIKAALVFFIVHSLYKGGLFMVAGIIDKSTGTRDITALGGLLKQLPLTSLAGVLALLSMAGLPPMLGFIGKELIYEAKILIPGLSWLVVPLGVSANILMVAVSLLVFYEIFLPRRSKGFSALVYDEKSLPWAFLAGPVVLAALGMGLGLFPDWLEQTMSNALYFVKSQVIEVDFELWHGFNRVLLMSVFTVAMGIGVFVFRKPVGKVVTLFIRWFDQYHLPLLFNNIIQGYLLHAGKQTNRIQHGYQRYYLLTFFVVAFFLILMQLYRTGGDWLPTDNLTPLRFHEFSVVLIASLAVVFATMARSRLSAILAMGVLGYVIGVLYMLYGAVDLAITQFLAETILMVIFVMVVFYLPRFQVFSRPATRVRDALVAVAVGIVVTLVVLKARFINLEEPISRYFVENSYTLGHGRNIVNVILVDFRALDTLGEITVLALAAAGVFSLLRLDITKKKPDR